MDKYLQQKKYDTLDVLRVFSAIAVIVIHAWPVSTYSGALGLSIQACSRFAVPFFLIVTGFFVSKSLAKRNDEQRVSYLKRYSIRLAILYVVWWTIYIPLTLTRWDGVNRLAGLTGLKMVWEGFKLYFLNFFTGSTFLGSWYISATLMGVWCVFHVMRRMSDGNKILIAFVLLITILIFENIGKEFLNRESLMIYTSFRNNIMIPSQSVFMAIPLLMIGEFINKYEPILEKLPVKILFLSFLLFNYGMFRENNFWVSNRWQFANDELFLGIIAAITLVLIGINQTSGNVSIPNAMILRSLSSFMYVSQFGIIVILRTAARNGILTNSITRFAITITSIYILFIVLQKLSTNEKMKWLTNLW